MIAVIASVDPFLSDTLTAMAREAGFRVIRTAKAERVLRELKQPERFAVVDMNSEPFQSLEILRQMRNVAAILQNPVVGLCPNQDEELKELARNARLSEVFLRFDMQGRFKDYLATVSVT